MCFPRGSATDPIVFEGVGLVLCKEELCKMWVSSESECGYVVQRQKGIHCHRKHQHQIKHECVEGYVDFPCGEDTGVIASFGNTPKASILLAEFMGNEDLDNNNQVYGKDFKIDPNDLDCPIMLKEIANHPRLIAIVTMTWQQYLGSI